MDNKIAQELSEILPQINIRGSVFSREYLIYSFGENTNWNASEVSIIINFLFNLYGRYPWIKEETEEEKAEREAKKKNSKNSKFILFYVFFRFHQINLAFFRACM
jgi:nicotinamide riboside transporter PnuC